MCITIPTSVHVKRARRLRLWQWLAATPFRLYLIGGALLLCAALTAGFSAQRVAIGWSQFNLLFAITPCLLLGPVFEFMPRLLKVTPPSYVRFVCPFFLLLLSQLLFLAETLRGAPPGLAYLLVLGLAWVMVLQSLRGMLRFSYAGIAGMAAAIFHLLLAGIAGLMIAIGLSSGWLPNLPSYAWIGVLPIYLFALLVLPLLHRKAKLLLAAP
jgi:hypothetical protein